MKTKLSLLLSSLCFVSMNARTIYIDGSLVNSTTNGNITTITCSASSSCCASINVPDNDPRFNHLRVITYNPSGGVVQSFEALNYKVSREGNITAMECQLP
jgi:hypothetical protein